MVKAWETGSQEILQNSSCMWKLVLILFPQHGCFFPITFTSYGIIYMGNTWVSPSISHSMQKCSEIHQIGRARESASYPFFPNLWVLFFHIRFSSYGILYHMGNAQLFTSIFNSSGKCSKIQPVSSQVVFPVFFLLVPKSGDSLK